MEYYLSNKISSQFLIAFSFRKKYASLLTVWPSYKFSQKQNLTQHFLENRIAQNMFSRKQTWEIYVFSKTECDINIIFLKTEFELFSSKTELGKICFFENRT